MVNQQRNFWIFWFWKCFYLFNAFAICQRMYVLYVMFGIYSYFLFCAPIETHTHIYIYRKRRHRVMYVQRESVCACVWPYDRTRGNPIVKEEKSSGNSLKRSLISNSLKKLNHITLKIVFITLNGISQQWCCFVRVFPLFDNKNAKSGWAKKWKRMNTHINVHP